MQLHPSSHKHATPLHHIPLSMASPASLGPRALRAGSRHVPVRSLQKRGLAAAASGSFQYETGDASGVKFASRDLPGATTTLTVVAKAGTRYQPLPGYTDALEKFAFKVCHPLALWYSSTTNAVPSQPLDGLPCALLGKQNCWVASFLHTILVKILSSEPNSSAKTYHISPNCWEKS